MKPETSSGPARPVGGPTDLELFAICAEDVVDALGHVANPAGVTIATTRDGRQLVVGTDVPDPAAERIRSAFEQTPHDPNPASEPAELATCARLLRAALGPVRQTSGPYYVFPERVAFESGAEIARSGDADVGRLRGANPGNWHAQEWDELLDGQLGPWAMATENGRVISICHTPRVMTARAAECGVWTDPDFRGRGHAAFATATWASMLEPTGRYLFYSTDDANRSSQRVAARLGLREFAWKWRLEKERDEPRYYRHALSRLRDER